MISRLMKYWTRPKSVRGIRPGGNESQSFVLKLDDLEIGRLELQGQEWVFTYSDAFRHQDSVKPLVGFSKVEKVYRSSTLWPFFVVRVPSLTQPSVQAFMQEQGVKAPDEVMLLKRFGRRAITNPFELVPQG